ncbi:CHAT domain-containing protein [Nocardia sp. NPDC127606]|uniref:CHAT domain-containing protein n=1 Tax=Nocardia sp. NPDC127606 TaxID=3345406 RepID=UPI00362A23B8
MSYFRNRRSRALFAKGLESLKMGLATCDATKLDEAVAVSQRAVDGLDTSSALLPDYLNLLGLALQARSSCTGSMVDEMRLINVYEHMVAVTPLNHPNRSWNVSLLGGALTFWFERTGSAAALERALFVLEQGLAATAPDHPERGWSLFALGRVLGHRYDHTGSAADLDRAIDLLWQALNITPYGHPSLPTFFVNIACDLANRFGRTGDIADLEQAIDIYEHVLTITPPDAADPNLAIANLGSALQSRYEHTGSLADLDRAIDLTEHALATAAVQDGKRAALLSNLGSVLQSRYEHTGSLADLDRAIDLTVQAIAATGHDHPARVRYLLNLGKAFATRFERTSRPADREQTLKLFREATGVISAPVADRVLAAREWGRIAAAAQFWDQAVQGFSAAVELMGLAAPRELGRADQEFQLSRFAWLASEATAACLQAGQPDRAVEVFEHSRAVLFSQVLDARSDLSSLRRAYPALAAQFVRCRDILDRPDTRLSAPADIDSTAAAGVDADIRKNAAAEFGHVLTEIRSRSGFERFLAPRRLAELLPAAENGPVVLLNVAPLRSDALILTTDGGVKVLPLPGVSDDAVIEQVNRFSDALALAHDSNVSSSARKAAVEAMTSVLIWLGDHITSPVLDDLGYTSTPRDDSPWPRVWWCPAGALSLLPIHAAGRHQSFAQRPDAVIDRVVSSTVPTLRALIHARRSKAADPQPKVLVVAMPHTPGQADLPGAADEAKHLQQLWGTRVTVLGLPNTISATYANVTAHLSDHAWVHFACHARSDNTNPSASHLLLADRPLTMTDLTQTRKPHAELAFLSACATAHSGTKVLDEPIHLAAGCQLAGYRHVIASLWTISDTDTAWLTKRFYTTLNAPTTVDTAAVVLHHAIRNLRALNRPRPHLWAPYTHTGP